MYAKYVVKYIRACDSYIGMRVIKNLLVLLCTVKPEMTNTPLTRKAAANKGINVQLFCKARGSPLPRFSWIFNGKTLLPNTTVDKYSITHSDVSRFIRCTYLLNNDFLYQYISFKVRRLYSIVLHTVNLVLRLTSNEFHFDRISMSDIVKKIFTVTNSKVVKRSQHPIKILSRETITISLKGLHSKDCVT